MDRKPNPAPFPVGTKVRFVGDYSMYTEDGRPICEPGLEATVIETRPGHRGTLRWIEMDDGDDPIQDTTRDGYSVVEPVPGWRRIASPENWEVV